MKKIIEYIVSILPFEKKVMENFKEVKSDNVNHHVKKRFSNNLDDQLHLIADSNFSTTTIMNKSEYKLFRGIQKIIIENKLNLFVFPQVNLGEIFTSENSKAFGCINSKRADLTIINSIGHPVMIIEYQGEGHYVNKDSHNKGRTLISDAIKREVCRKTGVIFFEIHKNNEEKDLQKILSILQEKTNRN